MEKPCVYIAAPLFNESERIFNEAIVNAMKPHVEAYLPQFDGILLNEAILNGENAANASMRVFEEDIAAIKKCDALLIVLNGRTIDEGAAFELGVAWTLGKPCVAYKDDTRQLLAVGDNPMITQATSHVLRNLGQVTGWAVQFSQACRERLGTRADN